MNRQTPIAADHVADQFASDFGDTVTRYVQHHIPTPFGSWPGAAARTADRRLRAAVALRLIGDTDERLRDLIEAYTRAADRIDACLLNCTDGMALSAEAALEDFTGQAEDCAETMRGELLAHAGRFLGEVA